MSQLSPYAQINFDDTIPVGTILSTPNNADTGYELEVDLKKSIFAKKKQIF